jgi:ABC-type sugar transport system ATPase subunit
VVERLGNTSFVYLDTELGPVIVEADQQVTLLPGDKVGLSLDAAHTHVFGADGMAWAVRT